MSLMAERSLSLPSAGINWIPLWASPDAQAFAMNLIVASWLAMGKKSQVWGGSEGIASFLIEPTGIRIEELGAAVGVLDLLRWPM